MRLLPPRFKVLSLLLLNKIYGFISLQVFERVVLGLSSFGLFSFVDAGC
jgi:hypothetical protein